MLQALKALFLIHVWGWMNSLFTLLALWGNKNWPPSMKVKKWENFLDKNLHIPISSCKNFLFSLLALWGNKNWCHSMKLKMMEIFLNKRAIKGSKWSSLNAPGTKNPLSHPLLELDEFPFPIIGPLG